MSYYGAGYGQPPSHGPPGGATPGFGAPPGIPVQSPAGGMPSQFQPPLNMPANFNWQASTIRLGVDGPQSMEPAGGRGGGRGVEGRGSNAEPLGNRNRLGLGARDGPGAGGRDLDRERAALKESMMALQPPTREEVARTIFVGGLGDGTPDDEAIESLLGCAGKLRRWARAKDAEDRKCKFGFAEYEDVDSLEAANEIFADGIEVPALKNGVAVMDSKGEVQKIKLLVVVDEQSKSYIDEWKGKRREDDDARQFRIDGCKEDLRQSIASLANAGTFAANAANGTDGEGDTKMTNGEDGRQDGPEIVSLPVSLEDELSDIPAEMRATVAAEIKAFRDRSTRRDIERLRREEELEQAEKQRATAPTRGSRLSPPPSGAPAGPNGAPLGPRGNTVQGAPAGPRGFRGAQLPNDYVNGVSFVNGQANGVGINREEEDAEESDEELERRRQAKRDEELQRQYLDAERKWQNRERTRSAALQRERDREAQEKREQERENGLIARRLREWNDEEEARLGREEYYFDRSSWLRKRGVYRDREQREDDRDRAQELGEQQVESRRGAEAKDLADQFLDQTGVELAARAQAQPAAGFKISLGSAAAKNKAPISAAPSKRGLADVEGLLEDEEDAAAAGAKRPQLKPLTDLSTAPVSGQDLTPEQLELARKELASEIPAEPEALFATPLQYRYLSQKVVNDQIRPFVERKIVDYLGVQEDLLVDTVLDGLRDKRPAKEILSELEPALEEEATELMKKVWRLGVFWGEAGARGLT